MAQSSSNPQDAIRIRMYRIGIGDCFLLRLPRTGGPPFQLLLDCGIHMAEQAGAARIRKVAENIVAETGGKLDAVVGTHEHWDHLSGFFHAADIFKSCRAQAIWCAWTENQQDPTARSLTKTRDQGVTALWSAMQRYRTEAADAAGVAENEPARDWTGLLGFFGDAPGTGVKAKAAADAMRQLVSAPSDIVYRSPGEPPFDAASDGWRIFVLGPPRDPTLLRHADPRAGTGEAYPFGPDNLAAVEMAAASLAAAAGDNDDPPFDRRYQIDLEASKGDPFFKARYWDETATPPRPPARGEGRARRPPAIEETTQGWRRIGLSWLDGTEALALVLDKITNNTSLVLALEIGPKQATDNPVVLFAADAQVGNWLSWQSVVWPDYHGRKVTGPDLLARTVIYKVGHHASHNATMQEGGLETMQRLRLALVPTNAEMAARVKWGTLPWPNLLARLAEVTGDRLLRSDLGASKNAAAAPQITVTATDDWFDIVIPPGLTLRA
jgi:hypothetical protein